ncbi:Group II intron-encoded protein LtrA [compost metagenome]
MEREEYAGARSVGIRECREGGGAIDLLEQILDRDNLNRAYKQVKRNHGAPGIDGMTVEDALPWLQEHREELLQSIRDSRYKPSPVRRKEIPKPDGSGVRKLGIPTVIDRVIQQAIAQQLQPLFEPLFSEGGYGYRPGRSAQQANGYEGGYGCTSGKSGRSRKQRYKTCKSLECLSGRLTSGEILVLGTGE